MNLLRFQFLLNRSLTILHWGRNSKVALYRVSRIWRGGWLFAVHPTKKAWGGWKGRFVKQKNWVSCNFCSQDINDSYNQPIIHHLRNRISLHQPFSIFPPRIEMHRKKAPRSGRKRFGVVWGAVMLREKKFSWRVFFRGGRDFESSNLFYWLVVEANCGL